MNEAASTPEYRQNDAMQDILIWSQDRELWRRDALPQRVLDTLWTCHTVSLAQGSVNRTPLKIYMGHSRWRRVEPG